MGGAPKKVRGSGTSLSKAEVSRGEVSLLLANPAPLQARDNQTPQGFRLSISTLLPPILGLYRQARGFFEGWTNHVKGQILIYHSCTNYVKGQVGMCFIVTRVYGDHPLSTCRGHSAERERQWNFPQQSRGVPRRDEAAVRQPSPSAMERQSHATGVPSKQFRCIATNSWFIQASKGVLRGLHQSR